MRIIKQKAEVSFLQCKTSTGLPWGSKKYKTRITGVDIPFKPKKINQ